MKHGERSRGEGDFVRCRWSCWLWSSGEASQVQLVSCRAKERSNPHSFLSVQLVPLQTGLLFKLWLWTPACREPSKVSYNNPARESLGAPCSHYKENRRTCPTELWLTLDLYTRTASNNRASVFCFFYLNLFVRHTVGPANASVIVSSQSLGSITRSHNARSLRTDELIISGKHKESVEIIQTYKYLEIEFDDRRHCERKARQCLHFAHEYSSIRREEIKPTTFKTFFNEEC